MAMYLALFKIK